MNISNPLILNSRAELFLCCQRRADADPCRWGRGLCLLLSGPGQPSGYSGRRSRAGKPPFSTTQVHSGMESATADARMYESVKVTGGER